MYNRQVRIGLVVGLILFLVSVTYFLLFNLQSQTSVESTSVVIPPATTPSITPVSTIPGNMDPQRADINTSNWLTYTNTKYKYEFKYPKDMEMDHYQGSTSYLSDSELSQVDSVSIAKVLPYNSSLVIYTSAQSTNQTMLPSCHDSIIEDKCLKELIAYRLESGYNPPLPEYQIIMINDVPAIRFEESSVGYIHIMFVKERTLITFTDATLGRDPNMVATVLSTLKF